MESVNSQLTSTIICDIIISICDRLDHLAAVYMTHIYFNYKAKIRYNDTVLNNNSTKMTENCTNIIGYAFTEE